jgi:eukaryotic-like serine/threonine-protein kinase
MSNPGDTPKSKQLGTEPAPQTVGRETRTYPFPDTDAVPDLSLEFSKIRRFEILDEIGRGGHGVVFRANDRVLRRRVALKLPRPEVLLSKEMRRRFVGEAQVAAALDHPNIIKVFDAGFDATVCYIAQELCTGPSLATWLQDHPKICPNIAAAITLALARGLEHAHKRGVLHRDLKPANVLLKPHLGDPSDESTGRLDDRTTAPIAQSFPFTPKLGDFGICKAFANEDDSVSTRTGTVLGTAAYMAPEQAAGISSKVGPPADVYGLGAILYEMLTGRPPIEGDSTADVLRRVLVIDPIPVRVLRPKVPAALEAICMKCLEKPIERRYATAAELADDLSRFLNGEPVRAPRHGRLKRLARAIGKPQRSTLALLALGLTGWMLAAFGFDTWRTKGSPELVGPLAVEGEIAIVADVRNAFNLWHENAERLRDNPNVGEEMIAALARHIPKSEETDRRSFGWHYVWRLCHPAESVGSLARIRSIRADADDVYFVTFSRDGSKLATSGRDRTARVWNANTGASICACSGHTDDVNWVDFSPDQNQVGTASDDHTVKVWDAATGKEQFTLRGHDSKVVAVRFSPMGKTLVSADDQGVLKLWDLSSRRLLKSVAAHRARIQSIAWGLNGYMLASTGNDNAVRLWEMPEMVFRSERQTTENQCASFSPVGDLIACGGRGTIHIDDVHTGGRSTTFSDHFDHIESIAFSPDGRQLASCDGHGVLRLWDLPSRKGWNAVPVRYHLNEKGERVPVGFWCVAYSPDGTRLATSARDGVVEIWDASVTPQWTIVTKTQPNESVSSLVFLPDGKHLALGRSLQNVPESRVQIWDVSSTYPSLLHNVGGIRANCTCPSRDGKELVVGSPGSVQILDAATGSRRLQIPLAANSVAAGVAFDSGGSLMVLEDAEKKWSISVFDPKTGAKVRTLADPFFATTGVHASGFIVSDDGNLLAICSPGSPETAVYELDERFRRCGLLGQNPGTAYAGFAPREDVLAVGSIGGVELWDLGTGRQQAFLGGLGRIVGPLVFCAEGRLLIVVSQEQHAVQVWDVKRRNQLFALPLPAEASSRAVHWQLAASPDGKQLACSIQDATGNGGIYLFSGLPIQ